MAFSVAGDGARKRTPCDRGSKLSSRRSWACGPRWSRAGHRVLKASKDLSVPRAQSERRGRLALRDHKDQWARRGRREMPVNALKPKFAAVAKSLSRVSKRKDSPYRSGRSPDWLKMKNADAPAVKREQEEEWGNKKRR